LCLFFNVAVTKCTRATQHLLRQLALALASTTRPANSVRVRDDSSMKHTNKKEIQNKSRAEQSLTQCNTATKKKKKCKRKKKKGTLRKADNDNDVDDKDRKHSHEAETIESVDDRKANQCRHASEPRAVGFELIQNQLVVLNIH
jgi:hypothetical protein